MDERFDWKAVMKEIIKPCKNDDDSLNKYQRKHKPSMKRILVMIGSDKNSVVD